MKKELSFRQMLVKAWKRLFKDVKSAKWAMVIIIAYFVFFKRIFYSMCPLVVLTGFPCPGCGLTRAGVAVLSLDFVSAWRIHPFIYAFIIFIILFCINRYFLGKKKMPVLRRCLIVTLIAMLVFYGWRLYRYFPGEPPMSYYKDNVLQRVIAFTEAL